jgi:succinate dehydrogenase (ubiquinone) membrane anchor subunit
LSRFLLLIYNVFLRMLADASMTLNRMYHNTAIVLAGLTPIALIFPSNSFLPYPLVDLTLSVLLPLHSHVAMNYVVTDYVPRAQRGFARAAVLATTLIAAAGLLKLSFNGPGLTEAVKELWRKPAKKE